MTFTPVTDVVNGSSNKLVDFVFLSGEQTSDILRYTHNLNWTPEFVHLMPMNEECFTATVFVGSFTSAYIAFGKIPGTVPAIGRILITRTVAD